MGHDTRPKQFLVPCMCCPKWVSARDSSEYKVCTPCETREMSKARRYQKAFDGNLCGRPKRTHR